ncbi:MAG TPA: DUF5676 family membrane protein [Sinorhizobium sp.]|nr:DUF5676 family membrane protein [Sinorhizobium sp.]
MPRFASVVDRQGGFGTPLPARHVSRIPVVAFGLSLGAFLTISYVLCVLFDLWFPAQAMNSVWSPLLPGFTWLTWPSFFLGLVETFAYGWYIALVFGPIYNLLSARFR